MQNDFRILQRLLSRGATLEDSIYTSVFRQLIPQSSKLIKKDAEPLLAFIQHIGFFLESESGWQLEIGRVIWSTAVELGLPFTRDPTVADFRITSSKDALVTRAIAAIRGHDLKALQGCLADGCLGISERHRNTDDESMTLLHVAVVKDNLPATSHLARIGCDPNIPAVEFDERWLPIHHCSSIGVFEELLAYGAQATDVEAHTGKNIWHIYATSRETETSFFGSVARRYPLETAEALLTKLKDGHTPLELVLGVRSMSWSQEERVERAMEFISICSDMVGFWSIHEPLFRLAASFGSERVIRRLIEAGARSDLMEPSQETPLHRLGIDSSPEMVQCLRELYPEALDIRYEGQVPLQSYLERCSRHEHPIEDAVAQQLFSAETMESIDGKGTTLWEHYCQFTAGFGIIWAWLLKTQFAMQVYENATGWSGLALILSRFITINKTQKLDSLVPSHVLAQAIEVSSYWESTKNEPGVLRFLQFAIKKQCYGLIDVLLDNGVSISEEADYYSSVQVACRVPLALSLCSTAEGRKTVENLLNLASLVHLDGIGRDGKTILHRLATQIKEGQEHLHWLIRSLLDKGVDINKKDRSNGGHTPITHHIMQGSLYCAELLLRMGADPGIAKDYRFDAAMQASYRGHRQFLDLLLETSNNQGSLIDWGRIVDLNMTMKDGQEITFFHINALHIACFKGYEECAAFYVENNLIDDLEAATRGGWTAMHISALQGNSRMIEYLHSKGCKVMPRTSNGETPLHLSVQKSQYDACRTLIRLGAQDVPDFTGITPTMYASNGNDKLVIQLLSEILSSENAIPLQLDACLPQKAPKALITAMRKAIKSDDIEECKRLYAIGCPIDVSIGHSSPLEIALHNGHLDVAEWLLDNGINTTACVCRNNNDYGRLRLHVIEVCLARSELNKLLAKLVDHCIHDGSGWPLVDNAGLSSAIQHDNTEGLSMLLKLLQERAENIRY